MSSRTALGPTQPPIQWVTRGLSLGVKRPGNEAGHSVPTTYEVKKTWMYTSAPPYFFMVMLTNLSTGTTLPFLHLPYKQIRQQEPVGSSKNFVYSNIRDISEGGSDVQCQYRTNISTTNNYVYFDKW
jgi:hypothetical protein